MNHMNALSSTTLTDGMQEAMMMAVLDSKVVCGLAASHICSHFATLEAINPTRILLILNASKVHIVTPLTYQSGTFLDGIDLLLTDVMFHLKGDLRGRMFKIGADWDGDLQSFQICIHQYDNDEDFFSLKRWNDSHKMNEVAKWVAEGTFTFSD
jgi:hypothetical protein